MKEEGSLLRDKWDKRYRTISQPTHPPKVLVENSHLLPNSGRALDLACGRGAGAQLLASHGLSVDAWDISSVAIEQLTEAAQKQALAINARVKNVELSPPSPQCYDVILVSHFLVREMAPTLIEGLKPGGLLFYQTFSRADVNDNGPSNPAYRLNDNELLHLFRSLRVRFYREELSLGDVTKGDRGLAMFVGERCERLGH